MREPETIDLAIMFARAHGKGGFVFWRAPDWREIVAVEVHRKDSEHVTVRARPIGRGHLASP